MSPEHSCKTKMAADWSLAGRLLKMLETPFKKLHKINKEGKGETSQMSWPRSKRRNGAVEM